MTPGDGASPLLVRRIVWAATVVIAVAVFALVRVPTHLGVEAPINDKRGSEYLWRVWWRARDDMIDVSPSWLFGVVLMMALVVFLVGILAAYRIALSIPSSSPTRDV